MTNTNYMKRILSITTLGLLIFFSQSSYKKAPPSKLEQVFEQYSKAYYALNPLAATQQGINDYNSQLEITISEAYISQSKELNQKYLNILAGINKGDLTADEILSVEILTYKLQSENDWFDNSLTFYTPVNQFVFS